MAQQADAKEELKHNFSLGASLENKIVELLCNDSVTGKKWRVKFTEQDYKDIDNEFDKMKAAIEGPDAKIERPDNNGMLKVRCGAYEFRMQEY